jgi:hypothetical protein
LPGAVGGGTVDLVFNGDRVLAWEEQICG